MRCAQSQVVDIKLPYLDIKLPYLDCCDMTTGGVNDRFRGAPTMPPNRNRTIHAAGVRVQAPSETDYLQVNTRETHFLKR